MDTAQFDEGTRRASRGLYGMTASMQKSMATMATLSKVTAVFYMANKVVGFADSTLEAMDTQTEMAERVKLTTNEYRRLGYAANQVGVETEALTTSIAKMEKNLGEGSDKTRGAISDLGLNFVKLKTQSPKQTFEEIINAINRMPNQFDKMAASMAIFGKGSAGIAQMKDLPKYLNDVTAVSLDRSILDEETVKEAADRMNEFKAALGLLKEDIVIGLIPSLESGAEALRDFINAGRKPGGENVLFGSDFGKGVSKVADLGYYMKAAAKIIAIPWTHGKKGFWESIADAFEGQTPGEQIAKYNSDARRNQIGKINPNITAKQQEANRALEQYIETLEGLDLDKFNKHLQDMEDKLSGINPLLLEMSRMREAGANLAPEYQKKYNDQLDITAQRIQKIIELEEREKEKKKAESIIKGLEKGRTPDRVLYDDEREALKLRNEGLITELELKQRLRQIGEEYIKSKYEVQKTQMPGVLGAGETLGGLAMRSRYGGGEFDLLVEKKAETKLFSNAVDKFVAGVASMYGLN